ncbi:MAG: hypothetical protein ABJZ55_18325 [Fuerstiella sp.]
MKRCFAVLAAVLVFQSAVEAQSDLRKIGKFLEGIQQIQNQNQQGRQTPPPRKDGPPNNYRQLDPNQSGDRNRGDFTMPPGFIVPPGNRGSQPYQPQPGATYPNQPYPNQPYPQQTYPQQTYPPGQYVPLPIYGEPPTAPRKVYSQLPIKIRCAPECVGTCKYDLIPGSGKAYPYTIRANQVQSLSETTDWMCRYQSVTGGAYQTYRLRGGKTYEMRRDNNRWQLYMVP